MVLVGFKALLTSSFVLPPYILILLILIGPMTVYKARLVKNVSKQRDIY
jgi:hypothetical protein